MNKQNLFLLSLLNRMCVMIVIALVTGICFTSCSDDDDDNGASKDSTTIMLAIDGKAFRWDDSGYSDGGYYNNYHYLTFTKTSDTEGTVGYRCDWNDHDWDGTSDHGFNIDYGTFTISNGHINVTMEKNYTGLKYLQLKGNDLVDDGGYVYQPAGKASDIQTHYRSPEDWQADYNLAILNIRGLFLKYDSNKSMGDIALAKKAAEDIKLWQNSARTIREEAARDHVYLEQSPYETKSIY